MNIEGKRILITGGTSGIGRALALQLAELGARVLVCGTHPARVEAMQGPGIRAVCCDVTEPQDVQALVQSVDANLGGLDVLVNCAGIQREVDLTGEVDMAEVERELDVNLMAPIRVTQALLPRLLASDDAYIVNVTSILAHTPKQCAPVYCASKAGFASWTTTLRYQLEARGVAVMELVPPVVATSMTEGRGQDKIPPETVAQACIAGLRRRAEVVRVGKARIAHALHRIAPGVAARMLRGR
jgi:uncharacterized oxidoreductase